MNKKLEKIISGRKIAICNIGKFQEDFEWVFFDIKPDLYIDDEYDGESFKKIPVRRTNEINKANIVRYLVIVCDIEAHKSGAPEREWERLEKNGLAHGSEYIFAEELFTTLDFDWKECVNGRKIAVWGTGAITRNFYMKSIPEKMGLFPNLFVDKDKKKVGKTIYGVPVISPESITVYSDYFFVIMTNDYYHEVYEFLTEKGLKEVDDFVSYKLIYDQTHALPSEMMRRTVYDKPLKDQPFCQQAFSKAHLRLDGNTILCSCPEYVDKYYSCSGNYFYLPYEKIWNSIEARIFRLSILNNTYSFCLEKMCDIMNPVRIEDITVPRRQAPEETETPPHVFLEMDEVCNLTCPSCRVKPCYNEDNLDYRRRMTLAEKLIKTEWFDKADMITIAGHGEVFYSKVYRKMLYHNESDKRKAITVLSNGQLFSEEEFQHLRKCYDRINTIISVDGTTKEIYEKLRPGGNFERLQKNLRNLGKHRRNNELDYFQINMVVQRENYLQLKDMVLFCEEIGVDKLMFIRMMNWLYPPEVFDQKSMTTSDGQLKPELEQVLRDPVFEKEIVVMPWFKHRLEAI